MASLKLTVTLTEDGVNVPGFPITRTITSSEVTGKQTFTRATGGGYVELPLTELGAINALVLTTDQDVSLRFNDQTDAGLPLDANGVLVLIGSDIPSGATSKASVSNASGSTATHTAYIGGV